MKVFVLGGWGGIGQQIQAVFKEQGDEVVAPRSTELNLSSADSIEKYLSSNKLTYASFDAFVHAAGYNVVHKFSELQDDDIQRSIQVNVLGFITVLRPFLHAFAHRGDGRVVVFSSLYGEFARSGRLPYVLSKHALHGIIKTLALEYAPSSVLINGIAPGFVDTPMTRQNNDAETIRKIVSNIPLGRMASPREIASFVRFLCSGENTYMTGQVVTIDGGYSIGGFQG